MPREVQASEDRYLGHCIDSITPTRCHTLPDIVRAIVDAPAPSNVSELKAFLGMLTYYQKFLPGISTVLEPLHILTGLKQTWEIGRFSMITRRYVGQREEKITAEYEKLLNLLCFVNEFPKTKRQKYPNILLNKAVQLCAIPTGHSFQRIIIIETVIGDQTQHIITLLYRHLLKSLARYSPTRCEQQALST